MSELDNKLHRVCFTGHRPEKLRRDAEHIKSDLEREIRQASADGAKVYISGMARGVDIWAAQIVLKLRDEGEAYAARLREYGNDVELHRIADAIHGFFTLPARVPPVEESYRYINAFLAKGSEVSADER